MVQCPSAVPMSQVPSVPTNRPDQDVYPLGDCCTASRRGKIRSGNVGPADRGICFPRIQSQIDSGRRTHRIHRESWLAGAAFNSLSEADALCSFASFETLSPTLVFRSCKIPSAVVEWGSSPKSSNVMCRILIALSSNTGISGLDAHKPGRTRTWTTCKRKLPRDKLLQSPVCVKVYNAVLSRLTLGWIKSTLNCHTPKETEF